MLRAHERDPHAAALQQLVQRFRIEEQSMTAALQVLNTRLELCHREAAFLRLAYIDPDAAETLLQPETLLQHCHELQVECDHLAIELVHVRMAVSGANEEFAEHLGRSSLAGPADWPDHRIALRA